MLQKKAGNLNMRTLKVENANESPRWKGQCGEMGFQEASASGKLKTDYNQASDLLL